LNHPEHTSALVAANVIGRPRYATSTPVPAARHVRPHSGFMHWMGRQMLNSKVEESMGVMERKRCG
jgi:hypothetical protein